MAKLSKTQVVYDGETFELGSEEAKIIYTALKSLNDGTAKTDGVGLAAQSYASGTGTTAFIVSASGPGVAGAASGQLFVTSSALLTGSLGAVGVFDVVCLKK